MSIDRFTANPTDDLDVTATRDRSVVRVSNRGGSAGVDVKLLGFDTPSRDRAGLQRSRISVPGNHDLVIAVTVWEELTDASVRTSVVEMQDGSGAVTFPRKSWSLRTVTTDHRVMVPVPE